VIDGCHIGFEPPGHSEEAYVNRHQTHSINGLFVAGPDHKYFYVNASAPGRLHDSRVHPYIYISKSKIVILSVELQVLRETTLWNSFEQGATPFPNAVILGDSAYPTRR